MVTILPAYMPAMTVGTCQLLTMHLSPADAVPAAAVGAGVGAAAGMPGQSPPTHNPLFASGDRVTQGALAAHPVSPGSTTPRGTNVTSGSASESQLTKFRTCAYRFQQGLH